MWDTNCYQKYCISCGFLLIARESESPDALIACSRWLSSIGLSYVRVTQLVSVAPCNASVCLCFLDSPSQRIIHQHCKQIKCLEMLVVLRKLFSFQVKENQMCSNDQRTNGTSDSSHCNPQWWMWLAEKYWKQLTWKSLQPVGRLYRQVIVHLLLDTSECDALSFHSWSLRRSR